MTTNLRWTAIIPVKDFDAAKSRLRSPDAPSHHLARAFLQDTLTALADVPGIVRVIVATHDPVVADVAHALGASVVDDTAHPGINAAALHAAAMREEDSGVLICVSDLPCLTSETVALALDLGSDHDTSFIADLDGSGTTMWLAPHGDGLPSHFGADSRSAHRAAGAVDLVDEYPDADPRLLLARRDVDTQEALIDAARLGPGPFTIATLTSEDSD